MKTKFIFAAFALMAGVLSSCNDNDDMPRYSLRTLTFEDTYSTYWSSKIDAGEYMAGGLLYAADMWGGSISGYGWYDAGNTELAHDFVAGIYGMNYASGGHAISNYTKVDLAGCNYNNQLSVPCVDATTGFGGAGGSKNFAMHNGWMLNDLSSLAQLPSIYFKDGAARTIDHMYVVASTYLANVVMNGDAYNSALADGETISIVATGYNGASATGSLSFTLCQGASYTSEWTKWDLSTLGKVTKIEFNVVGSAGAVGQYGLNYPGYFAYDNVSVRFEY